MRTALSIEMKRLPRLTLPLIAVLVASLQAQDRPAPRPKPGEVRAIVAVDSRLHPLVEKDLAAYLDAARARRGFAISVMPVEGLDDLPPAKVRERVLSWRRSFPNLEGVLYVGNVHLPSFFMPRADIPSTRLWPRYLEDLDMVAERRIKPGVVLREATAKNPWPSVAGRTEFKVPEHDFDWVDQGKSAGPELWAAFLPVGFADPKRNTYEEWAKQLAPFFRKALTFYAKPSATPRSLYVVSNDLGALERASPVWKAVGPKSIDYYAINEKGEGAFKDNPEGYQRAALEKYKTLDEFLTYAKKLPWMDEGWQKAEIFLDHMKTTRHRVVIWNVHSYPEGSLIGWEQARDMEGGGAIALLTGCSVGGFLQSGSKSHVDTETPVERNILANVVYGKSCFVAATGSPHDRVNDDCYTPLYTELFTTRGGYLGRAHLLQEREQDRKSPNPLDLRGRQEILIGDPFVDGGE